MVRTGWQNPWVRAVTTLLTAAVMVMIFCFSMENAENSDKRSGNISIRIIKVFHPMMLGFLLRLCLESWIGHTIKRRWIAILGGFGAGAAYACTDELHQLSIDGRSGQWTDVLVDGCGVLAGVTLGTLLIRSLSRKNTRYS